MILNKKNSHIDIKAYCLLILIFFIALSCHGQDIGNAKGPGELLQEKEQLSLNTDYSILGDVISTIDFLIKTDNIEDYEDGFIPWVQIEKPEIDLENLNKKDEVVLSSKEIKILIDYPLNKPHEFTVISEHGFTRGDLLKAISKEYHNLYEEEERTATIKTIPIEKRTAIYNRNETNGKYGIWGHDIADLALSNILVYKSKNGAIILALQIES